MTVTMVTFMTMTVGVATFMTMTVGVATFVSMFSSSVRVIIVTVIAMILMPMGFIFVLLRNRAAGIETDVGDNRKRHRFNRLLWR